MRCKNANKRKKVDGGGWKASVGERNTKELSLLREILHSGRCTITVDFFFPLLAFDSRSRGFERRLGF